jgi:hypothetical protein
MELAVEPVVAMCDEKVAISISGLPPGGRVKLEASMRLPWAQSVEFESSAWYIAGADGLVDPGKQKPDSGSYDEADGMGLLGSMTSRDKRALAKIGRNISVDNSLFIDVTAQRGGDKAGVRLERKFLAEGIRRLRIDDGFKGELFHPEKLAGQTVVFLGGSGSGLAVNSPYAALLAAHGFNVLSVAYFGERGLPAKLSAIPLEYFDRVFAWLGGNPATRGTEISLLAVSKGAELALILASRLPFIRKVAALGPHAYCFQGLAYRNVSSWAYGGKSLPFIRLKNGVALADVLKCFFKNKPFGFTHTYEKCLEAANNKEAARIKVENAKADLLLLTTTQCNMWNSYSGCLVIMDALRKSHYPHRYDLVVYENAGEPYFPPYVIPYGDAKLKIAPRLTLWLGGTAKGNARAQADSCERAVRFLKE